VALYYWVGGDGNTNDAAHYSLTSGGAGGAGTPTNVDDVITDAASHSGPYTITVNATWTTRHVTFAAPASGNVTLAGSSTWDSWGDITFYAGFVRTWTGSWNQRATTTRVWTSAGVTFASLVTSAGVGGSIQFADNFTTTTTFTVLTGCALDLNGKTLGCGSFSVASGATVVLTGATINATGNFSIPSGATATGSASVVAITITGNGITFGGKTYGGTVSFLGGAPSFDGGNTFNNLTYNAPSGVTQIVAGGNTTVSGTLTVSGFNSTTQRVLVRSSVKGTARTLTVATLNASNVNLQDIVGAGAASWNLSAITGLSGDCGGNSGITFTAALILYWFHGASASYNTSDATRWFLGPGGTGGAGRVPLPQDTGLFDAGSFAAGSKTVVQDMPLIGALDWTGATNSPTFTTSTACSFFGSLTLISAMTLTASGQTYTYEGRGLSILSSAGKQWAKLISVDAAAGTLKLGDTLSINSSLSLLSGTLDADVSNVTTLGFTSSGTATRVLNMGSGVWSILGSTGVVWNVQVSGMTVNKGTATVRFAGALTGTTHFQGGSFNYYRFEIATTNAFAVTLGNDGLNHTIDTLHIDASAQAQAVKTASGRNIVFGNVTRDAGTNVITLDTISGTGTFTWTKSGGGVIILDYLSVARSTASPAATFYATNSTDVGSNTDWTFNAKFFSGTDSWVFGDSGTLENGKLFAGSDSWTWGDAGALTNEKTFSGTDPWAFGFSGTLENGKLFAGSDSWTWGATGALSGLVVPFSGSDSWTWSEVGALSIVAARAIGRLEFGLFTNLRDLDGRMDASSSRVAAAVQCRGGVLTSGWSVNSGACYVCPMEPNFDDVPRDVVGVLVAGDTLRRVTSLAECVSTPGTFFYAPDQEFSTMPLWDSFVWDSFYWDQFRALYVHLSDDTDPSLQPVIAELSFWIADEATAVANLGDDFADNGSFESWPSGSLASWTVPAPGAYAWTQEATTVRRGSYSVKATTPTTAANGTNSEIYEPWTLVAGQRYQVTGLYFKDNATPSGVGVVKPYVRIHDVTNTRDVTADGRDTDAVSAATRLELEGPSGEWRAFTFDFIAPSTSVRVYLGLQNVSGGVSFGTTFFDDVRVCPVYRVELADSRILDGSIPSGGHGSQDTLFGGRQVGVGGIQTNNADGLMERLFSTRSGFDWIGRAVVVYMGDRDVPFSEWRKQYTAHVTEIPIDDLAVALNVADAFEFYTSKVAPAQFSAQDYTALDSRFEGATKPQWWGAVTGIPPIGIAKDATTGYRTYVLADMTHAPNGIVAVSAVYAYESDQAAANADTTSRVALVDGTDFSKDLANGRISILSDAEVVRIDLESSRLDFDTGSPLAITVPTGVYIRRTLAATIQTLLNAASSGFTVTYSETTHRFTITKASGTLSLLSNTGTTGKASGLWNLLGFKTDADKSAALTYTSDEALFVPDDVDNAHVLRVDGTGYKDDAAGTYTGTGNAPIEKMPDVVRHVWRKHLRQSLRSIDSSSFAAARVTAPESLWVYLNESLTAKEFFNRMEQTAQADLVVDGDGVLYCTPYDAAAPAEIELTDPDFIAWASSVPNRDTYSNIAIEYAQDPGTGRWRTRGAPYPETSARFSRQEKRTVHTYLSNAADAQARLEDVSRWASEPRLQVKTTVAGRLIRARVGTKLALTRERGPALNGDRFRVVSIHHDAVGRSSVVAVEDLE
jgi:hypothetical protein